METLSLSEYASHDNGFQFIDELIRIGFTQDLFARSAIEIARSVQGELCGESFELCSKALKVVELYWNHKVPIESCQEIADSINAIAAEKVTIGAVHSAVKTTQDAVYTALHDHKNDFGNKIGLIANSTAAAAIDAAEAIGFDGSKDKKTVIEILRHSIPWEYVCATQIVEALEVPRNKETILRVAENKKIIDYATIVLSQDNLRKEFEFIIKNFDKKDKQ